MSRFFKSAAFPILIVIVLAFFASKLIANADQTPPPSFSGFLKQLDAGQIKTATLRTKDNSIEVTLRRADRNKYSVGYPLDYSEVLVNKMRAAEDAGKLSDFDVKPARSSVIVSLLTYILPFVLFIGFWIFLMNQVQGGGSKVMSFGKSRAKRLSVDSPKITFRDVAGADEAVEELHEIKEFLENPKKFQALGARIPKGVLLYGPPGTGKTLLARAVAGEAGVPFFSISGSDFVEMFVGVGASRVRDLFEQAKQASPCIVFMDEIDAVGRHRGGDARLHRRRPREPRQRGGAARSAPRQEDDRAGGARGRDHARDRGPGEEDAPAFRGGAEDHRLPRARPRDRRPLPRAHRRRPQDLGHLTRPGPRLHDLAAARRPLPDDQDRLDGAARDDARRPRGGGARLPGGHHRRRERPREGHIDGEADDHALRHEREARPARPRPEPRHAVPRPRDGQRARLLRGDRARDRRRDPARDRGGARPGGQRAQGAHGRPEPAFGDPDRARDDRQGPVRAAPGGRDRGAGLPGGGSRAAGGEAGRGAEAPAAAEAAPAALPRRDHAASAP